MKSELSNSKSTGLNWVGNKINEKLKNYIRDRLATADVQINGDRPWDIQVCNEKFYPRILLQGPISLGETYVEGWWECQELDEFFSRIFRGGVYAQITPNNFDALRAKIINKFANLQTESDSFQLGEKHYDLNNELFKSILDKSMTCSCGYWKDAKTLDEAQEAKLDLVCHKLKLQSGMTVLDLGCGWGSFMKYAAEKYGVSCVGLTVSREQVKLGEELCQGLPVKFILQDYRQCEGKFDRVVSIEMLEHVGYKNHRAFMEVCHRCLSDDGLFLLETIGSSSSMTYGDSWFNKYLVYSVPPSIAQIGNATEYLFVMEDLHNFGADFVPTELSWLNNFEENWEKLKPKYGEDLYRKWKFFFYYSASAFKSRYLQVWQIVFSKNGVVGGYQSVR